MKKASVSVGVFGFYLLLVGALAVAFPVTVALGAGFLPTDDLVVRLIGGFFAVMAYYYLRAADTDDYTFFRQSIYVRLPVAPFLVVFWLMGLCSVNVALFGIAVSLSAIWTYLALRPAERPEQVEATSGSRPRHA